MAAVRWRRLFGLFGLGVDGATVAELRVSQSVSEVVEQDNATFLHVTEAVVEPVEQDNSSYLRVSQVVVEVIKTFTCAVPPGETPPGTENCVDCSPVPSEVTACFTPPPSTVESCDGPPSEIVTSCFTSEETTNSPASGTVSLDSNPPSTVSIPTPPGGELKC